MDKWREHLAVAAASGVGSGLFGLLVIAGLITKLHDAQSAIALLFAPFYALWIGIAVGLVVFGWRLTSSTSRAKLIDGPALPALIVGIVMLAIITAYLASEIHQATHPTVHPAYRELTPPKSS
jgi:hypothetical protein